jgi:neutral ceramidase
MGSLRAAAGKANLDPPTGVWMTGFGNRIQPSLGTHDQLAARAVLLEEGSGQLAIVSCDLLGFEPSTASDIRRRLAETSPIGEKSILICCTHTHSGPASMPMRGAMGRIDEAWLARAQERIVELVAGLPLRLQPARLAYGTTQVSGIGYNRQDQSHPIDEELIAVAVESESGETIATVTNYATHAVVLGYKNLLFSADFPGAVVRRLEELRGGVGLYLQGACGDVDPVVYRDRGWGTGTFEDADEIGKLLAEAAIEALADSPRTADVGLRSSSKVVELPLDPAPSRDALNELKLGFEAETQKAQAEPGDPAQAEMASAMLEWAQELESRMARDAVPRLLAVEVFAAGLGEVRLVGVPFETYSEIGIKIKEGLKPQRGIFVGYANGLHGYLASRWAKDQGGYGPDTACRWFSGLVTPMGYGADDLLIEECIALAKSL